MKIFIFFVVLSLGFVFAVDHCTLCALGMCDDAHPCKDDQINATGCVTVWINYATSVNLSYAGCWEESYGSCEELIDYEKQRGYDALCSICYEDNCNSGLKYV